MNGFKFIIKEKYCSFYKNDIYYGSSIHTNGFYTSDLEMPMFNINSKKNILDNQYSYFLWHYKLCHINKTRTTKLRKQGYLILLIMSHMKLVKLFTERVKHLMNY